MGSPCPPTADSRPLPVPMAGCWCVPAGIVSGLITGPYATGIRPPSERSRSRPTVGGLPLPVSTGSLSSHRSRPSSRRSHSTSTITAPASNASCSHQILNRSQAAPKIPESASIRWAANCCAPTTRSGWTVNRLLAASPPASCRSSGEGGRSSPELRREASTYCRCTTTGWSISHKMAMRRSPHSRSPRANLRRHYY